MSRREQGDVGRGYIESARNVLTFLVNREGIVRTVSDAIRRPDPSSEISLQDETYVPFYSIHGLGYVSAKHVHPTKIE